MHSVCPKIGAVTNNMQEAKIDNLSLQSIISNTSTSAQPEIKTAVRRFRRFKSQSLNIRNTLIECACQRRSETTVYLHWPISLSRTRTQVHESHCPHAAYQGAMNDVNMRFWLCSAVFKRKINIALVVSQGLEKWSIAPSLCTYRIVSKHSAAFALLTSLPSDIHTSAGLDGWIEPARALFHLFQMRQASPYERLANGQTLLHIIARLSLHLVSAEQNKKPSQPTDCAKVLMRPNIFQRVLQIVTRGELLSDGEASPPIPW
jgi:hypothetical protein